QQSVMPAVAARRPRHRSSRHHRSRVVHLHRLLHPALQTLRLLPWVLLAAGHALSQLLNALVAAVDVITGGQIFPSRFGLFTFSSRTRRLYVQDKRLSLRIANLLMPILYQGRRRLTVALEGDAINGRPGEVRPGDGCIEWDQRLAHNVRSPHASRAA